MVSEMPRVAADVVKGIMEERTSVRKKAKLIMDNPHKRYPKHINSLRLPILSESAPMNTVVSAAATEEAATIRAMSAGVA